MMNLSYPEILTLNQKLNLDKKLTPYKVSILSNITINQIKEVLDYSLKLSGVKSKISIGQYDNITQEVSKHNQSDLVIIFFELANLKENFHTKINLLSEKELREFTDFFKSTIDMILSNLKKTPLVLFNKFSPLIFSSFTVEKNKLEKISDELNIYLEKKIDNNVKIIDIDKLISNLGINQSVDMRLFYGSKSLYSIDFYKSYSEFIKPIILSSLGKIKKALILDCDNTLWHGILGEDGYNNIKMGDDSYEGRIFQQIQEKTLELYDKGVFICLCTKNNYEDVIEVINKHKDMRLKKENFSVIKSNWKNKADNIIEIAKELNIGLDSLVFVDDSDFELELVKKNLPEVSLFKVPQDISKYYYLFNKKIQIFYKLNQTREDKIRNIDFKHQLERKKLRTKFKKIEDYLDSLDIKIEIKLNDKKNISRISQMTLKTNQFNLTTHRYSEKQIKSFLENKKYLIFTLSLKDKFGDSGITGLAIIKIEKSNNTSTIDTFLLSCRIIGRNAEYAFMNFIISHLKKKKINLVKSNYIRSSKNKQVENFYEQCLFEMEKDKKEEKSYSVKINKYKPKLINYIQINE